MAVTKITCPECNTVLKPAKPLPAGKPVKCPECGHRFTAPEEEAKAPLKNPKKAPAGPEAAEPKAKPAADGKKASPIKAAEKKAPAEKKPEPKKTDDDEEGGVYGYLKEEEDDKDEKPDIEYAPDMSTKDLRGPAQAALVQPSNALIIVGLAGFFGWLALIVIHLIPIVFPIDNDDGDKTKPPKPVVRIDPALANVAVQMVIGVPNSPPPPGGAPSPQNIPAEGGPDIKAASPVLTFMLMQPAGAVRLSRVGIFLIFFIMVLGMIYAGFVTYGAVRIQSLDGYEWGIAGCILAIIPFCALWGFTACVAMVGHILVAMMVDDPAGFTRMLASVIGGIILLLLGASTGVGVWVLMVMRSETVIKGYEYKAD